jgi:hypothetical protein
MLGEERILARIIRSAACRNSNSRREKPIFNSKPPFCNLQPSALSFLVPFSHRCEAPRQGDGQGLLPWPLRPGDISEG